MFIQPFSAIYPDLFPAACLLKFLLIIEHCLINLMDAPSLIPKAKREKNREKLLYAFDAKVILPYFGITICVNDIL